MREFLLFASSILISSLLLAQEIPDTLEIEKEPGKIQQFVDRQQDLGIFGSIIYGTHPQPDGYGTNGRIETGILFNRYIFGAFYAGYDGDFSEKLIFPNTFTIEYEHAGLFLGYKLIQKSTYQLYGKLSFSKGFVQWTPSTGHPETFFRDDLSFTQPELQFEATALRFLRLMASLGYKISGPFSLPQLNPGDLEGFYISGGFKFGWFKKPQP